MAWTTPGTATAGEVLTAAFWNEQVRDNMLIGNPIFADEAARDAAIPSPVEGQRCYLTAPTIPAATGEETYVPSGVQTIYNGSVWVCVTEVGALTTNAGTTSSTSYTASLSGTPGTNPSVTLVTGTTVVVSVGGFIAGSTINYLYYSVDVSGATTLAASDVWANYFRPDQAASNNQLQTTNYAIIGGLTAGTNTFTINYRVAGGTGTYANRRIVAKGIA